jgi:DNA-binding NtrC family response regulator
MIPDAAPYQVSEAMLPLFGKIMALLAMKYGRAPLPVSASLVRRMVRSGFPKDVDEMTNLARRYLFLRDERMLLAELKLHGATAPVIGPASTDYPNVLPE